MLLFGMTSRSLDNSKRSTFIPRKGDSRGSTSANALEPRILEVLIRFGCELVNKHSLMERVWRGAVV